MALNPITFTEGVIDDFLHYQLTTYPLADPDLHAQLRKELELEQTRQSPLRKGPFVSLSRPFRDGATIKELVTDGVLHPGMTAVATHQTLRAHQERAIRAIVAGDTTLVSTGTGSGKTEAFLYPIISRCLQLEQQGVAPGVVAVLVYPMNALAEDQLERLRGLLAGRGVPFGMYVGKTPETESDVTGVRMASPSTNSAYQEQLKQMRAAGDVRTLRPAEERCSRAIMRSENGRPRILLTNVKQLELLLTRGKDVEIFADAPLEFLVFDEAHTFRGAQGAETATLIRRLRTFCGRDAAEVRHVATSATMADPRGGDGAAIAFARRFFGVSGERVTVVREAHDELPWNEKRGKPAGPPSDPAAVLSALLRAVDAPDGEVADAISIPLTELGGARLPQVDWQDALASQLASNELVYQLAALLHRPLSLQDLEAKLSMAVAREVPQAEILCWLALGAATARDGHDPVLRPIVHTFVRGVGGAVVTFSGPDGAPRLWLAGEDAELALKDRYSRFALHTCTTCGQHYHEAWVQDFHAEHGAKGGPSGGNKVDDACVWPHLPGPHGGTRVMLVDRLVVSSDEDDAVIDAVIEATGEDDPSHGDDLPSAATMDDAGPREPDGANPQLPRGHDFQHRRLVPVFACSHCGSLQDSAADSCAECNVQHALVPLQAVRTKQELPGQLHACVACQAIGRRPGGGRYREPARPVRAVSVSDVHVLAQSILKLSERKRLLVFADNRQDAAFQAGWMRDHARRFRLRALIADQLSGAPVAIGDLVHRICDVVNADESLSRGLLTEVWQVASKDESPEKHTKEVEYYLRIQVLRELAVGTKQRLGLEAWGRLRVDYRGVDPTLAFIQRWAPVLDVAPEALCEGIKALLDHMRRSRLVRDPTKLFETHWNDGDNEIQRGYVAPFAGGPRGVKLRRDAHDLPVRATQWLGSRATQVSMAVAAWGVAEDDIEGFLTELWDVLVALKVLAPTTLYGWKRPLRGGGNVLQLDSAAMTLVGHVGRFRCQKCRRTTIRQGPTARCMAWRCGGALVAETVSDDDFDLRVLDGSYPMIRVEEHSAQVPHERRERAENRFKGDGETLNTLVCTPTLELGVDIGSLDAILMRNVPPTAANYWQRAGRAGRRHRMAVDITYAQATGFDQAYFRAPEKLLAGRVEPPRFNLGNAVMIRKHVHATVLTTLLGVARAADAAVAAEIQDVMRRAFPPTLAGYLFDGSGHVRPQAYDAAELAALIGTHREAVVYAVAKAFTATWPAEDADSVTPEVLARVVDGVADSLQDVIQRFKRRLDWALSELRKLADLTQRQGDLDPEDQAHERRCRRVVARFKGSTKRGRGGAQGGPDDAETMGALAREGFLPGYGLESGSILGQAEPPRFTWDLDDFDLPRPPTLALREYVPGNAIYANGLRFIPRRFQLRADAALRYRVLPDVQVVIEAGKDVGVAKLGHGQSSELRVIPVCDVTLPSQSQISDDEEFRFQMPSSIYGTDRGYHRGGDRWHWAGFDIRFRRGISLRLVNVGPRRETEQGKLGFPLCLACGQSLSPFASGAARKKFDASHLERCKHQVEPTGFYADVEVDALSLHDVADARVGISVAEAMRMGAARVLDMEVEDLQLLVLGHADGSGSDILLYDPMPGGSGLLQQLLERWVEVRDAIVPVLEACPGGCETSCIDCMQTFRNRYYHESLDRKLAVEKLSATSAEPTWLHSIPEHLAATASTTGVPQTHIEGRFKQLLAQAGLPSPVCQHPMQLGAGFGSTIPDFFYPGSDDDDPGVCIYLDGMAGHIHGNAEQQAKDAAIRARLLELRYEVVVVASFELDDEHAVVAAISRIAKYVVGKDKHKALKADLSWVRTDGQLAGYISPTSGDHRTAVGKSQRFTLLPGGRATRRATRGPSPSLRIVDVPDVRPYAPHVPIVPLQIAAGAFSSSQDADPREWQWAEWPGRESVGNGMFIAQVIGESMNRRIPNGTWCLWRSRPMGSLLGRVVLAEHRDIDDPEHGGRYTVKVYAAETRDPSELGGRLRSATLRPDTDDARFGPIHLSDLDEVTLNVIAELVEVLPVGAGKT